MRHQKTPVLKNEERSTKWHHIDVEGKTLGRVATIIADLLRGKNSPKFTANIDSGDFVVVTNCEKIQLTGKKLDDKVYNWHTNYIGGIKSRTAKDQLARNPRYLLMEAVKGMLPKSSLGRKQLTKLKVFTGNTHAHESQKPVKFEL